MGICMGYGGYRKWAVCVCVEMSIGKLGNGYDEGANETCAWFPCMWVKECRERVGLMARLGEWQTCWGKNERCEMGT